MEFGKHYEAFKEILDEQIKKIAKKGDISPQELDSVYKLYAIKLDMETEKAMKQQGKQSEGSYDYSRTGMSNHYPWFMYQNDGHNMSNRGNSYAPVWNQGVENKSMHEVHSNDNRNSYDHTYDAAYDGAYDGSYAGS